MLVKPPATIFSFMVSPVVAFFPEASMKGMNILAQPARMLSAGSVPSSDWKPIIGSQCSIQPPGTRLLFWNVSTEYTWDKTWVGIGGNVLISLLIQKTPLLIRERAEHSADMDQIKALSIHPRLQHIIDLECAVRWHPGVGDGEKIHAADRGGWVAVGDVDGPAWC